MLPVWLAKICTEVFLSFEGKYFLMQKDWRLKTLWQRLNTMNEWLNEWINQSINQSMIDWLTDWLTDLFIYLLTNWKIDLLIDWSDNRASPCPWRRDVTGSAPRRSYAGARLCRWFPAVVRRRRRWMWWRLVHGVVWTCHSYSYQQAASSAVVNSGDHPRLGQGSSQLNVIITRRTLIEFNPTSYFCTITLTQTLTLTFDLLTPKPWHL